MPKLKLVNSIHSMPDIHPLTAYQKIKVLQAFENLDGIFTRPRDILDKRTKTFKKGVFEDGFRWFDNEESYREMRARPLTKQKRRLLRVLLFKRLYKFARFVQKLPYWEYNRLVIDLEIYTKLGVPIARYVIHAPAA